MAGKTGGGGRKAAGSDGDAPDAPEAPGLQCPLCKKPVAADGEAAAALNRHFETDCTWRHTSPSPVRPPDRR